MIFIFATHGGSGRLSGAEVRGETGYLYRVRNGKVSVTETPEASEGPALETASV